MWFCRGFGMVGVMQRSVGGKDFDGWNAQKKRLNAGRVGIEFREGRIYWCAYGANVGIEIDGKNIDFIRPVLVIRKFSKECFWGVPLTTKPKKWFEKANARIKRFYYRVDDRGDDAVSLLNLTQLRMFDAKRIVGLMRGGDHISVLSDGRLTEIKNLLKGLL